MTEEKEKIVAFEEAITKYIEDWCAENKMEPFEFSGEYRDGYVTAKAKTIKTRPRLTVEDSSLMTCTANNAWLHTKL